MENKSNEEWAALVAAQTKVIDRLTLELAARQPLADSFVAPVAGELPPLPAAIHNAFMTLETKEGRYSIVMKFNQAEDAFDVHSYLVNAKAGQRVQQHAAVAHNKHCGCPNCCVPAAGVQGDAEAELLDMLGRIHPMAMKREDDIGGGKERLTRAFTLQQPWPVPDQACIVWRADLMRMSNDLTHKQAFFDHTLEHERKAKQQPDSGRDAALEGFDPLATLKSCVALTECEDMAGIKKVIAWLAAHPAPSSDAATGQMPFAWAVGISGMWQYFSDFDSAKEERRQFEQDTGDDHEEPIPLYRHHVAAHSANGAQAGDDLSRVAEAIFKVIKPSNMVDSDWPNGTILGFENGFRDQVNAAAQAAIRAFAAPQKKEGWSCKRKKQNSK